MVETENHVQVNADVDICGIFLFLSLTQKCGINSEQWPTGLGYQSKVHVAAYQVSGIRYQVSGILILPGEPLANGYCKWHPEKKGKKNT